MRKLKTRSKTSSAKRTSKASSKSLTGRKPSRKSTGDRGAAGFAKAKKKHDAQEKKYERERARPFDFYIKPGEEAEVVILDHEEPFFTSLHKVQVNRGGRKFLVNEVCLADRGEFCPLCSSTGREGSYTMLLTVLDRRPYKDKQGKTHKVTKRLMPVKGRNLSKFERQFNKYDGDLRGLRVMCRRNGDKEASIGEDLEFLGKVPEKILKKYGENSKVADYVKGFSPISAKEMRTIYNLDGDGPAGSQEFDNNDDDSYDSSQVDW